MLQVIYHNTTFYCGFANKAPTKIPTVSELLGFPEEKVANFFFFLQTLFYKQKRQHLMMMIFRKLCRDMLLISYFQITQHYLLRLKGYKIEYTVADVTK